VLVAGATGYIGRRLALELSAGPTPVRCLARDPSRARDLERAGCELVRGDVLDSASLGTALAGVRTAYYLVHSMGRGSGGGFAERDARGAENFADAAGAAGAERIVYLGGLSGGGSEHLESRHRTAGALAGSGVPLSYLRAAAVIGGGSESFRVVYYLVKRLPMMITPRWTETRTQPIAIADVIAYLVAAGDLPEALGREIEIGGPQVTTYGGMMDAMAQAFGRRPRPRLPVPVLTPRLSSLWVGLVTPVDVGVARPLIEGLSVETVVRDRSGMDLFDVETTPLAEAMAAAVRELELER